MIMEKLKNRKIAVIISVAVIIVSVLIGVNKSVYAQIKKLNDSFENGVYISSEDYTQPGIGRQLAKRTDAALGLVTLASEFGDMAQEQSDLRSAREALMSAGTIQEKFLCNEALEEAYKHIVLAFSYETLDEKQQNAYDSYTSTMDGAQSLITSSSYNRTVAEFENEVLNAFPVNILHFNFITGTPEYFRAEG